ncbi:hypothetical protein CONPUDRAFT_162145 [Coniophora puteana RWD-64-598 SS2]|uniref:Uncharacterized protein n=1 Tax=Coniophora puteana (strain RWD-64-598) TaxID=741705 RepID=A0A5M3N0C3_CONPW|nr:uncharacterized protein CONPUDRAFT_162145 [Coniophora puteana RWD-64-598 SS2]EIW84818.1 hypothetical protein CONPUDRAFT_162145 [Coniophora puteana RWD-64-598 SS2]
MRIYARPLSSVFVGNGRVSASMTIENRCLLFATILRDSVVDRETGNTDIVIIGTQYEPVHPHQSTVIVARLSIPSEGGPVSDGDCGTLSLSIQTLKRFDKTMNLILTPAWNGSTRIAYCDLQSVFGVSQVMYDDETQTASMVSTPETFGAKMGIQDHFRNPDIVLESLESEPWSGRLAYTYQSPEDDTGEQRMLCVLDFV